MANNRATKSGFAAEAQRKVSCLLNITIIDFSGDNIYIARLFS